MTHEFTPTDPEVVAIAGMFAVARWKWATWDGRKCPKFVPDATQIARTLSMLADSALYHHDEHPEACAKCQNGDREYCGERPHWGRAATGRLFVEWGDGDGYGVELTYGIEWQRHPLDSFK